MQVTEEKLTVWMPTHLRKRVEERAQKLGLSTAAFMRSAAAKECEAHE